MADDVTVPADELAQIRARAAAHQEALDPTWLTPQLLAARWGVSVTTVRDIPRAELPYKEFGRGLKLRRRRYSPQAVAAYERDAMPDTDARERRKVG